MLLFKGTRRLISLAHHLTTKTHPAIFLRNPHESRTTVHILSGISPFYEMARPRVSLTSALLLLLLLLLMTCAAFKTEARSLRSITPNLPGSLNGLHLKIMIKNSGPSPSGPGHKYRKLAQFIGWTKSSGPSPGVGH